MALLIKSKLLHTKEQSRSITSAWTPLRPHPVQRAYYECEKRFPCAVAGRRSGKTELTRRRIIRDLGTPKEWYDPRFFYALPTRDQAKRVAWDKLKALVPLEWEPKFYESDLIIKTGFNSELLVIGMDKPQRAEGVPFDGGALDECSDHRPNAFSLSIRPALSDRRGYCRRVGVPKRYGVGSAEFKSFCESHVVDPDVAYFTWLSADILPEDEIDSAKRQLSKEDFDEQYGANWLNPAGTIFYAFLDTEDGGNVSRLAHYDPTQPIAVGMDFNVNPMAWTLSHIRSGKIYTFAEIWLRNVNTAQALNALWNKWGSHHSGWYFFGDASSRARKTSSSASDYIQILQDGRFNQYMKAVIDFPAANPALEDRFAAANAKLCNAAGERSWFIHPDCTNLRKDLSNRHYREDERVPSDSGDLGHITDAATYPIHRMFPLKLDLGGSTGVATVGGY